MRRQKARNRDTEMEKNIQAGLSVSPPVFHHAAYRVDCEKYKCGSLRKTSHDNEKKRVTK